ADKANENQPEPPAPPIQAPNDNLPQQPAPPKPPADKVEEKPPFQGPEKLPNDKIAEPPQKKPVVDPVPDGPVPALIASDIVKKVKQSTVYLKVTDATGKVGEGSGFFGLEPGVVITNAHVVGMLQPKSLPPKKVEVVIQSGTPNELRLEAV